MHRHLRDSRPRRWVASCWVRKQTQQQNKPGYVVCKKTTRWPTTSSSLTTPYEMRPQRCIWSLCFQSLSASTAATSLPCSIYTARQSLITTEFLISVSWIVQKLRTKSQAERCAVKHRTPRTRQARTSQALSSPRTRQALSSPALSTPLRYRLRLLRHLLLNHLLTLMSL